MLYKDLPKINHRNKKELSDNIIEISKILSDDNSIKSKMFDKTIKNPDRSKCDYNDEDSPKETEKRMCRCMYFCNKEGYDKCLNCNYNAKYKLINSSGKNVKILSYEETSKYVENDLGNVDLIIEYDGKKYATEVKPYGSEETLMRMVSEILTYCCDENFKDYLPAIMFPDNNEGEQEQLKELKYYTDNNYNELNKIMEKVKFFKYKREKIDNGYNFEILEFKLENNS